MVIVYCYSPSIDYWGAGPLSRYMDTTFFIPYYCNENVWLVPGTVEDY
jgi:hypothetical protein